MPLFFDPLYAAEDANGMDEKHGLFEWSAQQKQSIVFSLAQTLTDKDAKSIFCCTVMEENYINVEGIGRTFSRPAVIQSGRPGGEGECVCCVRSLVRVCVIPDATHQAAYLTF